MLSKLSMELVTENQDFIVYNKAAILQSILMEQINQEYASYLHISGLHPYSQAVFHQDEKNIWTVYTTNLQAYQLIIEPLKNPSFTCFYMENNQCEVKITSKREEKIEKDKFMDKYYFEESERYFHIKFCTPTAFKSQGKYIFYPDLQLIYQSLINKFDASSENIEFKSEEVLEQLTEYSEIVQYQLKSISYCIGKNKIPAFIGQVTIKINGPQLMVNFVNLLFHFGEYSGIGIKAAMGMGNIKVLERDKK